MEVESGPEKKRLAVVSKGLKIVLEYLVNIFLVIDNSEIMAHPFYGISHNFPKSEQLKIIKDHGLCFLKSFGLWILKPCLFLQFYCVLCTPSSQMTVNIPF